MSESEQERVTPTGDAVGELPFKRMLWRGLRKRCPVCGGRKLFKGWFQMKERCPTCGFRFEREEGSFLGAFVINVVITEAGMLVALVAGFAATLPNPSVPLLIGLGVLTTIVIPLFAYPWTKTVWAAIDLAMHPLEPWEEAEIAVKLADRAG
ncbi:MAG TPA: DUF983 domain-containing protein [Acidimicrobiales bacterium]|nr:DUF983 domain-containing protein [Acidimicrobiales bacterium]